MILRHLLLRTSNHRLIPPLSAISGDGHNLVSHFSTLFPRTKTPKKHRKRRKKPPSPRVKPVQHQSTCNPYLEAIVERDRSLRFLTRSKQFLCQQPEHVVRLDDAGKLYRELGFPRGRKVHNFLRQHPLLFQTYRHSDDKMWMGFTSLMEELVAEENSILKSMETDRITKVRKLLMMAKNKKIPLSTIHHCRYLFGIPDDFRDRVLLYPNFFKITVEKDDKRALELVNWDSNLAVSQLEKDFTMNEDRAKRTFKFRMRHSKHLDLDHKDIERVNCLNTLPLVSPYSDGWKLDVWSLEAEKYRVGVLHEFLSLTLEKKASIHHFMEFKDELSLTKSTYEMLKRQARTFYLAGTEMNWVVFLKDAYDEKGNLIHKDPQVVFRDKLYDYAAMKEEGANSGHVDP